MILIDVESDNIFDNLLHFVVQGSLLIEFPNELSDGFSLLHQPQIVAYLSQLYQTIDVA